MQQLLLGTCSLLLLLGSACLGAPYAKSVPKPNAIGKLGMKTAEELKKDIKELAYFNKLEDQHIAKLVSQKGERYLIELADEAKSSNSPVKKLLMDSLKECRKEKKSDDEAKQMGSDESTESSSSSLCFMELEELGDFAEKIGNYVESMVSWAQFDRAFFSIADNAPDSFLAPNVNWDVATTIEREIAARVREEYREYEILSGLERIENNLNPLPGKAAEMAATVSLIVFLQIVLEQLQSNNSSHLKQDIEAVNKALHHLESVYATKFKEFGTKMEETKKKFSPKGHEHEYQVMAEMTNLMQRWWNELVLCGGIHSGAEKKGRKGWGELVAKLFAGSKGAIPCN